MGLTQQEDGLVGNAGVGQRWIAGNWLVGYNTFYDNLLDENLQRAGVGAEAWGEYLRLSANYYHPLGQLAQRHCAGGAADGARVRRCRQSPAAVLPSPHYQHSFRTIFWRQRRSATAVPATTIRWRRGLRDYTPHPAVDLTAAHKQGESGVSQNNLGLEGELSLWRTAKETAFGQRSRREPIATRQSLRSG